MEIRVGDFIYSDITFCKDRFFLFSGSFNVGKLFKVWRDMEDSIRGFHTLWHHIFQFPLEVFWHYPLILVEDRKRKNSIIADGMSEQVKVTSPYEM